MALADPLQPDPAADPATDPAADRAEAFSRLAEPVVEPLADNAFLDKERLALLLEGAAWLAHLDAAGSHPPRLWDGVGRGVDGRLTGLAVAPGRRQRRLQVLLGDLLARLFGLDGVAAPVAGRGVGRRAARALQERWTADLVDLDPVAAVGQILDAAPFLWEAEHGASRAVLARETASGRLYLAAPGPARRRLEAAAEDESLEALVAVLASPRARELWTGPGGGARRDDADDRPEQLARRGRWARAVAAWRRRPPGPKDGAARVAFGRALVALGRFAEAAQVLDGLGWGGIEAPGAILRLRCRSLLGEIEAVGRALGRLGVAGRRTRALAPELRADLAETAVRVLVNQGRPELARRWVEAALEAATAADDAEARGRARIVAAGFAWDRGDAEAMAEHLEAARRAVPTLERGEPPRLAWRWWQARGLAALGGVVLEARSEGGVRPDGDAPPDAAACLERALGCGRRRLGPFAAGSLWNDLGLGRAARGDLAGAERAFRHAARLSARCQGLRRTTLALHNLAEIRLRRGRLLGVRPVLEASLEENRLTGNRRAVVQDLTLLARWELAAGRLEAADARARQALDALEEAGEGLSGRQAAAAQVLRARAFGWRGRAGAAGRALATIGTGGPLAEALGELEPEERPALLALAERRREAEEATAGLGSGWRVVWEAILGNREAAAAAWDVLGTVEPYRAARLVLDAELLAPGRAPAPWRRRAAAALRHAGAVPLAERLEGLDPSPWRALGTYLEGVAQGEHPAGDPRALRRLFTAVGFPEARLERTGLGESDILVGGSGGPARLAALEGDGELALSAAAPGPLLRALFALARRELTHRELTRRGSGGGGGVRLPVRSWRPGGSGGASTGGGSAGEGSPGAREMVGESAALVEALERLDRLATSDLPVLVLGESGTGKELAARRLHGASRRRGASFVPVNCAALSENLVLSDLFGHVRGAFTGADGDRVGVFETAEGGTVFLDEIGDLPAAAQGMLLRTLQEGEVRRLGETMPRPVDARVVAATHRDLEAMVEEGAFRRDLFFRLRVGWVTLPPLREREGDVLLLAEHLLARRAGREEGVIPRLTAEARARLLGHGWPGNVRELENVLAMAAALAEEGVIGPEHLELEAVSGRRPVGDYHARVDALRRRLVEEALEASKGNRAEAARMLGLSRQAMSYLTKQLRIVVE